jgi:hypothetical protein
MYHFCIYIYVHTFFAQYSPSYTLSLSPPFSHWYTSLPSGVEGEKNCSTLLFSDFVELKRKK